VNDLNKQENPKLIVPPTVENFPYLFSDATRRPFSKTVILVS
jgi:hypothetical protein